MADTTVLQEFLMELGFEVKKGSLEALTKSLKGGATEAVAFGNIYAKAAEQAVKALGDIVKGTMQLVEHLDEMYFASRRIGESASDIEDFALALSAVGVSGDEAMASLKSIKDFSDKFKGSTGASIIAGVLGLDPRQLQQANGQLKSSSEIFQVMQRQLHDLYLQDTQRAEYLREALEGAGIHITKQEMLQDPNEIARVENAALDRRKRMGVAEDQYAAQAHKTAVAQKEMNDAFQDLQAEVLAPLIPQLTGFFESTAESITEFGEALRKVPDIWDQMTAGMSKSLGDFGKALKAFFSGDWAGAWASASTAALESLRATLRGVEAIYIALSGVDDLLRGKGEAAGRKKKIDDLITKYLPQATDKAPAAAGAGGAPPPPHPAGAPPPAPGAPPPPAGGGARGVHWDVAQHLYQMLVGLGANPEAARGAVGVLGSESMGFNVHARPWSSKLHKYLSSAMGLGQWLKDRRDAYEKATGQKVGEDEASQMALMRWELTNPGKGGYANVIRALAGATTAGQGADIWERMFEGLKKGHLTAGRDDYAIDAQAYSKYLLGPGGGIGNTTYVANVTVNGARDPHETARQVKEAVQNVQIAQRQLQHRAA